MSNGLSKSLGQPVDKDPIGNARSFIEVLQAIVSDPGGVKHAIDRYIAVRESVAAAYAAIGPAEEIPQIKSDVERLRIQAETALADARSEADGIKEAARIAAKATEDEIGRQYDKQVSLTDAAAQDRAAAAAELAVAKAKAHEILGSAKDAVDTAWKELGERETKLVAMEEDLKKREAELAAGREDLEKRIEAMKRLAL